MHNDFQLYNIVAGQAKKGASEGAEYFPVIVDFGNAKEHICTCNVELNDYFPLDEATTAKLMGCGELYDACCTTEICYIRAFS